VPHDDSLLEFHPAANLFPLLEGEAFDALVEDIRERGLLEPLEKLAAGVECP